MWYPAAVTVAPSSEPISLVQAKTQCRVDGSDSDVDLSGLIAAARSHLEAYCGTPFVARTVAVKCDTFADFAAFPVAPLSSVSSVEYFDSAGVEQVLDSAIYEARGDGLTASVALITGKSWPSIQTGSRITVTAAVGYDDVPDAVKHAMLLLISHWFDNRSASGSSSEIPHGVDALLSNFRRYGY